MSVNFSMSKNTRLEWSYHESTAFEVLKNEIMAEFRPNYVDDYRIERFLKARDFDVKQAKLMLKKDLEWRKKNNVDTILQDYEVPEVPGNKSSRIALLPRNKLFEKYLGVKTIGFDKDGSPVLVANLGEMDHRGLSKSCTLEELLRYLTHSFESIEKMTQERSEEVGRTSVEKWTAILNVEGYTFAEVSNKTVIERNIKLFSMYEAHYPELLKAAYVINGSTYFNIFLNILKPFFASKILQKVKFYGKDGWKEDLLKIIDPEILPAYLGGEKTDPDGNPLCYTIVCHAGPVPQEFYFCNSEKRGLRGEQGVTTHAVKRRSKLDLQFEVQVQGSFLEWEIETENFNIGFGLFYKDSLSSQDTELETLIPVEKMESHLSCQTGIFKCVKSGTYILTLDNSFSIMRSKTIYYRISVLKPDEKKTDL